MIYFCVKFQKDPLFGVNLTYFAPVTMAMAAILNLFNPSLPHTTVDIPIKLHEA
jgi:hypothetical protein